MMFEDNASESDEPALEELESPQSVLGSLLEPNGESWKEEARVLLRQESPAAKQPVSPEPEGLQPRPIGEQHRNSALHRRPIVSVIGAILLASALGGGYVYLDYAKRISPPTMPSSRRGNSRSPRRCPAISPPSRSPTTSMPPPGT